MRIDREVCLEIKKGGALYFLVSAFIGAYNRRTDAWKEKDSTSQAELDAAALHLKTSTDALEKSVGDASK